MTLSVAPASASAAPSGADTTSATDHIVRSARTAFGIPELQGASAMASASLDHVATYVGMLRAALGEDPGFYARLVRHGFLDSAINHARYARDVVEDDHHVDNDGFRSLLQRVVIDGLLTARGMGTPTVVDAGLSRELEAARIAAADAARSLRSPVAAR